MQGTLACSADTGAANCATSVRDVLREVLKVAALPDRATRDRAANRLTGTERSASSCSRNHSLPSAARPE